ncbi:hypothetical protein GQ457_01G001560 [Hibiscus cannabinus]
MSRLEELAAEDVGENDEDEDVNANATETENDVSAEETATTVQRTVQSEREGRSRGESAMSRESQERVWTLFVSNIADQLHWQGVWQVFDRHGEVVDVFISMRRSRRGQRFGFVRMATRAAALRVIERLHMRWIYGTRISVAFALRRGRDETWHLRKERQRGKIEVGGEERRHVLDSGESVTGKVCNGLHKSVTRVVAEDKLEVLDSCAVAWCKEGLRGRALVEELRRAEIRGCSVMRISGAMVLLMFVTTEELQALLDRYDLDRWFARIVAWSPEVRLDSRSVWVSVVGLPIHLWLHETFANLASLWGKLIRVEGSTMEPQSFERARFLIESDKMDRIEEMVEVKTSEGLVVQVRVQEVEVVHSHDVIVGLAPTSNIPGILRQLQFLRRRSADFSSKDRKGVSVILLLSLIG